MSTKQLLQKYREAYADPSLQGIRGDLRTPGSRVVVGTNMTPLEAYDALLKWFETGGQR